MDGLQKKKFGFNLTWMVLCLKCITGHRVLSFLSFFSCLFCFCLFACFLRQHQTNPGCSCKVLNTKYEGHPEINKKGAGERVDD